MPDTNPNDEFVYVRLSGQGADVPPGRVSRAAYDTIWAGKGWVIVPNDEAELLGSPATVAEMRAATDAPASEPEPEPEPTAAAMGSTRRGK